MGMGYAAVKCIAIKYDDLKALCPTEVAAIENHPKFETWGDLAYWLWVDDQEELGDFKDLVANLTASFEKATTVDGENLSLILTYYDEENGDRYDEVEQTDGCIFELDKVQKLTTPAEKLKEKLNYGSYVVFG